MVLFKKKKELLLGRTEPSKIDMKGSVLYFPLAKPRGFCQGRRPSCMRLDIGFDQETSRVDERVTDYGRVLKLAVWGLGIVLDTRGLGVRKATV